jgi:hypothetical protein
MCLLTLWGLIPEPIFSAENGPTSCFFLWFSLCCCWPPSLRVAGIFAGGFQDNQKPLQKFLMPALKRPMVYDSTHDRLRDTL